MAAPSTDALLLFESPPLVVFEELRAALSDALAPLDIPFRSIPTPSARRAVFSSTHLHVVVSFEDKPLRPEALSRALNAPLTRLRGVNYDVAVSRHRSAIRLSVQDGAAPSTAQADPVSDIMKLIVLHRAAVILAEQSRATLLYWPQSETVLSARELAETAGSAFPATLATRPVPGRVTLSDGTALDVMNAERAEDLIGLPLMIERPPQGLGLSHALAALSDALSRMVLSAIGPGAVREVELDEGWTLSLGRKRLSDDTVVCVGQFARDPAWVAENPQAAPIAETETSEEDVSAVAEAVAFTAEPDPVDEPVEEATQDADAQEIAAMIAADPQPDAQPEPLAQKSSLPVAVSQSYDPDEDEMFDATLSNEQLIAMELATRRSHALRAYALCACIAVITPIPAAAVFLWNLVRGPNLYVTLAAFGAVLMVFAGSDLVGIENTSLLSGIARAATFTPL